VRKLWSRRGTSSPTTESYTYAYEIQWPEVWPEPWRETHPNAVLVERRKLELIAKPARLYEIRRDSEWLMMIEKSMQEEGVLQPLWVVTDDRGKITLWDGHHRLLCAAKIGMDLLPVEFKVGNRIRGWGRELHVVAAELFRSEMSCAERRPAVG
jgi:hypothetical protein